MGIPSNAAEFRFAFVRHAMSVDNEAWRLGQPWPGIADAPLCARGREMLPDIAAEIADWWPQVVVSSPLSRCIETARAIVQATNARLDVDFDLREIAHNEGDLPLPPDRLAKAHTDLTISGMEDERHRNETLAARALRVLRKLSSSAEERVCLVGHRGWLMEVAGLDIENGELVCLKVEFISRGVASGSTMVVTKIARLW